MDQTSETLPFFPLSVFLFPGEDIPLRIFEPRYKQLIEDVRNTGTTFGIPYVLAQDIQEFGCEVCLSEVLAENPGGRMVISVRAVSMVQILSFRKQLEGKLYAGGGIRRLPAAEPVKSAELINLIRSYSEKYDNEFLNTCDKKALTHQDVIKALNLPSDDKFKFFRMPSVHRREEYLAGQLRYLGMIRTQEIQLGNDFGLN